jgi:hypothetical protein
MLMRYPTLLISDGLLIRKGNGDGDEDGESASRCMESSG